MRDVIEEHNPDALILEPKELDKAIIGISYEGKVIYSYIKLVDLFMTLNTWSSEDAEEWISYNINGAYVGEYTPIIMYDLCH